MHIPDGYLSPTTAVVMYGAAAPFWWRSSRVVKRLLTGQTVPLLALFSAFCFTVMMFNIPIPGGTTAHAVGGTLAAIVLGPWPAIIAVSVALIIQAIFFGDGGITAIGANCFNMAIVLPLVGYGVYWLLARNAPLLARRRVIAAAIGGYIGINMAGLLVGIELGIQPIFWSQNGHALYAPYPLSVAIPAMLIPHLTLAGAAEAIATAVGVAYVQRVQPQLLRQRAGATEDPAPAPARARLLITAVIAVVMLVAVPLGLLASGGAWGEWGSQEIGSKVGYVPSGLQRLNGVWSAPLSGYTLPWIPGGASFGEQAVGYILSAIVGAGVILIAAFAVRILARRRADAQAARPPSALGG